MAYINTSHDVDSTILEEFADFCPDPPEMRNMCWQCRRPAVTCWCSYLPQKPFDPSTTVIILQHPYEESRRLKTAPMLQHSLVPDKCRIITSKKFRLERFKELQKIISDPNTMLMYPSDQAIDLKDYIQQESVFDKVKRGEHYNLILLDGTWFQARGIYCRHPYLQQLKQVKLSNTGLSEYVIRTQPNDASLSTLETAAIAIAMIENNLSIKDELLRPLRALCKFQMEYGAEKHHSKQYLIENGLYKRQVSRLQMRKFIETGGVKVMPKILATRCQYAEEDGNSKDKTGSGKCSIKDELETDEFNEVPTTNGESGSEIVDNGTNVQFDSSSSNSYGNS